MLRHLRLGWVPLVLIACSSTRAPGGGAPVHDETGASSTEPDGTDAGPAMDGTSETEDSPMEESEGRLELPPLVEVNDGRFATSAACATCHRADPGAEALHDTSGRDVSPAALWEATMMANAARDPFWWAMVRAEVLATPSAAGAIESECTRCHAPMAGVRVDALWEGVPMSLSTLKSDPVRGQLGLDGVACAACHKIGDAGLTSGAQWSGNLDLRAEPTIFGPHADPFTMPMQMHTGFVPTAASHLDDAALCAGCHTLDTEPVDDSGRVIGSHFSEQSPYLEWLASGFSAGDTARSCQQCHMPSQSEDGVPITTRIARRPGGGDFPPVAPRSPFHRHVFVGGNTIIPAILRDHRDELHPSAPASAFDAVIERATEQLQTRTATVTVGVPSRRGDVLAIPVSVHNLAGHKLPSGYPSRRMWIEIEVRDGAGQVVFHSGGVDAEGRLVDASGAVLDSERVGGPIQAHRDVLSDARHVQIYETIMGDADRQPVFRLLRAVRDAKDNRLLPVGWRDDGPYQDRIAPELGTFDANFVGGSDDVTYEVVAPNEAGPHHVDVRLRFQPIAARFAAELFVVDASEIRAFERMWSGADRSPVILADASITVP